MEWKSEGVLIRCTRYGERFYLASFITQDFGLRRGLINVSKYNELQPGNLFFLAWSAKREQDLGYFKPDLLKNYTSDLTPEKFTSVEAVLRIISKNFLDSGEFCQLFFYLKSFLENLNHSNWKLYYLATELAILQELGVGLDLSKCGVTGSTDDLFYLSPRTGRAICYEVGKPYHDKMFVITDLLFVLAKYEFELPPSIFSAAELTSTAKIISYFLGKRLGFMPQSEYLAALRLAIFFL